jgi:hypothetical protein
MAFLKPLILVRLPGKLDMVDGLYRPLEGRI